jgi:hypothetical protein
VCAQCISLAEVATSKVVIARLPCLACHLQERLVLQLEAREGPGADEHPVAISIKVHLQGVR